MYIEPTGPAEVAPAPPVKHPLFPSYEYHVGGDAPYPIFWLDPEGPWYPAVLKVAQAGASVLEHMHDFTGLPWWATVVGGTFMLRMAVIPISLFALRNASKAFDAQGDIKALMRSYQTAMANLGPTPPPLKRLALTRTLMKGIRAALHKANCFPWRTFATPLVHWPLLTTGALGARHLVLMGDESFETGGMLWFQDLTLADPTYILPALSILSSYAFMEYAYQTPVAGQKTAGAPAVLGARIVTNVRNFFQLWVMAMAPFTFELPAGLYMAWIAGTTWATLWVAFIRTDAAHRLVTGRPTPRHVAAEEDPLNMAGIPDAPGLGTAAPMPGTAVQRVMRAYDAAMERAAGVLVAALRRAGVGAAQRDSSSWAPASLHAEAGRVAAQLRRTSQAGAGPTPATGASTPSGQLPRPSPAILGTEPGLAGMLPPHGSGSDDEEGGGSGAAPAGGGADGGGAGDGRGPTGHGLLHSRLRGAADDVTARRRAIRAAREAQDVALHAALDDAFQHVADMQASRASHVLHLLQVADLAPQPHPHLLQGMLHHPRSPEEPPTSPGPSSSSSSSLASAAGKLGSGVGAAVAHGVRLVAEAGSAAITGAGRGGVAVAGETPAATVQAAASPAPRAARQVSEADKRRLAAEVKAALAAAKAKPVAADASRSADHKHTGGSGGGGGDPIPRFPAPGPEEPFVGFGRNGPGLRDTVRHLESRRTATEADMARIIASTILSGTPRATPPARSVLDALPPPAPQDPPASSSSHDATRGTDRAGRAYLDPERVYAEAKALARHVLSMDAPLTQPSQSQASQPAPTTGLAARRQLLEELGQAVDLQALSQPGVQQRSLQRLQVLMSVARETSKRTGVALPGAGDTAALARGESARQAVEQGSPDALATQHSLTVTMAAAELATGILHDARRAVAASPPAAAPPSSKQGTRRQRRAARVKAQNAAYAAEEAAANPTLQSVYPPVQEEAAAKQAARRGRGGGSSQSPPSNRKRQGGPAISEEEPGIPDEDMIKRQLPPLLAEEEREWWQRRREDTASDATEGGTGDWVNSWAAAAEAPRPASRLKEDGSHTEYAKPAGILSAAGVTHGEKELKAASAVQGMAQLRRLSQRLFRSLEAMYSGLPLAAAGSGSGSGGGRGAASGGGAGGGASGGSDGDDDSGRGGQPRGWWTVPDGSGSEDEREVVDAMVERSVHGSEYDAVFGEEEYDYDDEGGDGDGSSRARHGAVVERHLIMVDAQGKETVVLQEEDQATRAAQHKQAMREELREEPRGGGPTLADLAASAARAAEVEEEARLASAQDPLAALYGTSLSEPGRPDLQRHQDQWTGAEGLDHDAQPSVRPVPDKPLDIAAELTNIALGLEGDDGQAHAEGMAADLTPLMGPGAARDAGQEVADSPAAQRVVGTLWSTVLPALRSGIAPSLSVPLPSHVQRHLEGEGGAGEDDAGAERHNLLLALMEGEGDGEEPEED